MAYRNPEKIYIQNPDCDVPVKVNKEEQALAEKQENIAALILPEDGSFPFFYGTSISWR